MSPTSILDVRGLTVELPTPDGPQKVLNEVNLCIGRGEIIGIVGESGAGKSTLGAAVAGLLVRPLLVAGGEIWLDGVRIDQNSEDEWRRIRGHRIGMVFQDPLTSLDPLFTIGDQLTETIRVHLGLSAGQAHRRATELLDDVGITEPAQRLSQYPHQLSGGMRQRVVIALALCGEPSLIVADEPTSSLDVSVQMQIIRLLQRICAEHGTAIMLISHDLGVVSETAQQIGVMYCGRLVELGSVAEVTAAPLHPYTTGLIDCIPALEGKKHRLTAIGGELPRLGDLPTGCSFHPRCTRQLACCSRESPPTFVIASRRIACWLHEGEAASLAAIADQPT
jgi:peptide/nickel transport system ATP-binding protein